MENALICKWIDLKVFPINLTSNRYNRQYSLSFGDYWLDLFSPIEYCKLVLSDSNHFSLLASRREKGGGTFNPISGGVENIH